MGERDKVERLLRFLAPSIPGTRKQNRYWRAGLAAARFSFSFFLIADFGS